MPDFGNIGLNMTRPLPRGSSEYGGTCGGNPQLLTYVAH